MLHIKQKKGNKTKILHHNVGLKYEAPKVVPMNPSFANNMKNF